MKGTEECFFSSKYNNENHLSCTNKIKIFTSEKLKLISSE